MEEMIKQVQAICNEGNVKVKFVNRLPGYYLWLDVEGKTLFIDVAATEDHLSEFIKHITGRSAERGDGSL